MTPRHFAGVIVTQQLYFTKHIIHLENIAMIWYRAELKDSLSQNDRTKRPGPCVQVLTGLILNLVSSSVIFGLRFRKISFSHYSSKVSPMGA